MTNPNHMPGARDFIDFGLQMGFSGRRTLQLYREWGGTMRTDRFYELWRERDRARKSEAA